MFGNSVGRGFPVSDNLVFSRICGAIVLILALIGVAAAWWRGLFRHRALPWVKFGRRGRGSEMRFGAPSLRPDHLNEAAKEIR